MSKQTIKEAIAKNITGQGNQVDLSGQLGTILDAIVDALPDNEPLVIEGTLVSTSPARFAPNSGQPDKTAAISAFDAGRIVKIKFSQASLDYQLNAIAICSNTLCFSAPLQNISNVMWS